MPESVSALVITGTASSRDQREQTLASIRDQSCGSARIQIVVAGRGIDDDEGGEH